MKAWQLASALSLGVVGIVAGVVTHAPVQAQAEPTWLSDFEEARALSTKTGKPLFVAFR